MKLTKSTDKSVFYLFVLFILLLVISVFIVPYSFAPFKKNVSASFDYHFNNAISLLGLLLFNGALLLYFLFKKNIDFSKYKNLVKENKDDKIPVKHLIYASIFYLLIITLFYFLKADYGYGESNYFLVRIDQINQGLIPYKNFEYAYGVLLLYLPQFINSLFHFSSTVTGYYIALLFFNVLGLYLIYFVINFFNVNYKNKIKFFYSLTIAATPFGMGENYTFTRFALPIACLIVFDRILNRWTEKNLKSVIWISAYLVFFSLINFLISIEMGIAVFIAATGYLFLLACIKKQAYYLSICFLSLALISVALFLFNSNFFLIIKTFGAGGNNWPVIASPSMLFFLLCFLTTNTVLGCMLINTEFSFLPFAIITFSVILGLATFGRCDPGHVFYNGLWVFIFMWAFLFHYNVKYHRMYNIAYIMVFSLGMQMSGAILYRGMYSLLISRLNNPTVSAMKAKFMHFIGKKKLPVAAITSNELALLKSFKRIALPFNVDKDIYLYLLNNKIYVPEYYLEFLDCFTQENIDRKLQDLKNEDHKFILIPKEVLSVRSFNTKDEYKTITYLFLYPYNRQKLSESHNMYLPIYNYVQKNYKQVIDLNSDYVLLERK